MADLYVSEFVSAASAIGTANPPVCPQPALAIQKIAIGGASVQSSAFNARTKAVMLVADGACHVLFGADPTATAASMLIPANVPIVFGVISGGKLAVIS